MSKRLGKSATKDFVNHLKLGLQLSENDGLHANHLVKVQEFIADSEELSDYNEWGVALENLLNSLYEIEFPLDDEGIALAQAAILANELNYEDWKFIKELRS